MITWKIQVVRYIVVMLFLIHYLTFSIFSMVLLLFLADFASMSISTDNVKHSLKPDSHIMNIAEGVLFTMALFSYFGLSGSVNRLLHLHLCLFGSYRVIYSNDGTRTKPFLEVEAKYSFDHHNGWGDPACDRNLAFWLLGACPSGLCNFIWNFGLCTIRIIFDQ